MPKTVVRYAGSFIGENEITHPDRDLAVINPYNQEVIGNISCAIVQDVDQAVEKADEVFRESMKKMPAYKRSEILRKTADLLEGQFEDFARMLTLEAGKPIQEARGEVTRAVQVLRFSAEGAKAIYGEHIPMDSAIGGEKQIGITKRVPIGVIAAITPFNFPLNLVLHKVAPAIATGNTVVLKPAEKTPFSAVMLHRLFHKAGLPAGAFNIVMGPGQELVKPLVTHPKVKKVTFTGSGAVGWMIKEMVPRKRVTLELGSNAPNIIFSDADLQQAVDAITMGGYTFAGQACVAAQRVYVEQSIYDEFVDKLVEKLEELHVGDPLDEKTTFGPMITEEAAIRAESWINDAVVGGAKVVTGGKREGTLLEPTVLTNVTPEMKVVCAEVFAPIVTVIPFETEDEAVAAANDSEFGLHAGVFTKNIDRAFRVAEAIETGGVWINEVSVRRYDHIPYGGVKNSGFGKEGVKYAMEDMLETKFIGIKL